MDVFGREQNDSLTNPDIKNTARKRNTLFLASFWPSRIMAWVAPYRGVASFCSVEWNAGSPYIEQTCSVQLALCFSHTSNSFEDFAVDDTHTDKYNQKVSTERCSIKCYEIMEMLLVLQKMSHDSHTIREHTLQNYRIIFQQRKVVWRSGYHISEIRHTPGGQHEWYTVAAG